MKRKIDPKYATFNRRMLAATIDSVLILLVIAPFTDYLAEWIYHPKSFDYIQLQQQLAGAADSIEADKIFIRQMNDSHQMGAWIFNSMLQSVILCIATGICWKKWSATPGKILLRMRVVDAETEAAITNKQILLRLVGYVVSTVVLCIGFFWISVDRRRQGWHDKMADTVVILVPKKP